MSPSQAMKRDGFMSALIKDAVYFPQRFLLLLEALQTTNISKIPPFPIKTRMVNESFLDDNSVSEILSPPRKQHSGHVEDNQNEFSGSLSHLQIAYISPIPTTTSLSQGDYKIDFKEFLN
jgi:hypothetical protein